MTYEIKSPKTLVVVVFLSQLQCLNVSLSFDFASCADDLLGGVDVAVLAHVHHGCPAGSDDSSGPGARDGGRGVDSALPVRSYKVLVVTVLFVTVEDN